MTLGMTIKKLRKANKIGRRTMASEVGISVTALYNIEHDLSFPRKETLRRICDALGVPVAFVLISTVTEEDVPEEKREVFRFLITPLKKFLLDESK